VRPAMGRPRGAIIWAGWRLPRRCFSHWPLTGYTMSQAAAAPEPCGNSRCQRLHPRCGFSTRCSPWGRFSGNFRFFFFGGWDWAGWVRARGSAGLRIARLRRGHRYRRTARLGVRLGVLAGDDRLREHWGWGDRAPQCEGFPFAGGLRFWFCICAAGRALPHLRARQRDNGNIAIFTRLHGSSN